jgi:hypothetical protein
MRQFIIPDHKTLNRRLFQSPESQRQVDPQRDASASPRETRVKSVLHLAMALLVVVPMCVALSAAKELPDAPSSIVAVKTSVVPTTELISASRPVETKTVDAKFFSLALISTGSAFADSYTTLFARQNWLAGKKGVCNVEVESAYLYGTHPTVARSYLVASAKSASAIAAAYYLRKHHSRLWSFALLTNAAISLQGVTQNMIACN